MTDLSQALSLAAYLADPQSKEGAAAPWMHANLHGQEAFDWILSSRESVQQLTALLRRNRVSLLPVARSGSPEKRRLVQSGPLAAHVAAEEQAYDQVRREYVRVRRAFAAAGIQDVLIKAVDMSPSFPHLSDNVDDLVPAAMVPAARSVLQELGYVELRNLEEPGKFFFKRFCGGQQVAAHHLHAHVGWAVPFLDEQLVLRRSRPAADDPDLCIPHPEDALLITIAHAFYENKTIKLGDVAKVRHCLRSTELDWDHMHFLVTDKGWADGFAVLVIVFSRLEQALYGASLFPAQVIRQAKINLPQGDRHYIQSLFDRPLALPLPISFAFSKRLFYAKCLHDRGRNGRTKLYDIVRHTLNGAKLKLKLRSQPGMLITFSGVDGSGKTRHAEALVNAFQSCDIRAVYVWSRAASSPFTDAIIQLGKFLLRRPPSPTTASQEQRASGRRDMLRNPAVRLAWMVLMTVDLLWQYMWRVRLPLLVGRVVVCDRYTYDAMADVAAVTGSYNGLCMHLLTLLSPRPSRLLYFQPVEEGGQPEGAAQRTGVGARAAFLLTVPPDDTRRRRPQDSLSAATLAHQSAIYAELAYRYHLIVVDNSKPFDDVNDAIVRAVIQSYFVRYHTLINGLFMANPARADR